MQKRRSILRTRKKHRTWQLQEAKARFSELVNEVVKDGYQTITKNGHPVVVVMSHKEFEKMNKPKNTLGEFLSESPFSLFDLEIERDKAPDREIDL